MDAFCLRSLVSRARARHSSREGKTVNKSQFIEALAAHFEGNKKQAGKALDAVIETITREVSKGEKVAITGFGAFEKVNRPARMVRNRRRVNGYAQRRRRYPSSGRGRT